MLRERDKKGDETTQRRNDGLDAEVQAKIDPEMERVVELLSFGLGDVFVVTMTDGIDVGTLFGKG